MEHARLRLGAARLLFDEHLYGETLSRSYFAMFAAAKALLAAHGSEARGHKGVHHLLYKNYDLDTALYHRAWTDREDYDYRLKQPDRSHAALPEPVPDTDPGVARNDIVGLI